MRSAAGAIIPFCALEQLKDAIIERVENVLFRKARLASRIGSLRSCWICIGPDVRDPVGLWTEDVQVSGWKGGDDLSAIPLS